MKAVSTKQTAHRLAAVLSLTLAFATGGVSAANVVWNGNAANGSLSDGGNWDGGVAPVAGDTLDFSAVTSATTLNADFADGRVFETAAFGSGVVTMAGNFRVNSLTNAEKLAIPQGALLSVTGNITAKPVPNGTMYFLYSNEGTVIVGGKAIGLGETTNPDNKYSNVRQYQSVNANTQPMRVNGLAYNGAGGARLRMFYGGTTSKWIVGSGGLTFPGSRQANYSVFQMSSTTLTLYSSADWTLANVGKVGTTNGDLCANNGPLVLDTTDGIDASTGYTVTLNGRLYLAGGNATIKGCGTVVIATTAHNGLAETTINSGKTLYITDTATLQMNSGKVIAGEGAVSLASGTKLLVPDASATVTLPSLVPVAGSTIVVTNMTAGTPAIALTGSLTMPTGDGKVALKIGGTTQLEDGIYTILSSANALPADVVDHLTLDASEVVSGDCSLYAKGGVLLLLVGIAEPGYGIWVGGTDNNLSTAANWLNEETPRAGDTLNFKTVATATTLNSDFEDDRVFATAVFGSGVVTLTGGLNVTTLTNANKLTVSSGASLTVTGDLVGTTDVRYGWGILLHSNEGVVTANRVVGYATVGRTQFNEYESVTANTTPICARGIVYKNMANPAQLIYMYLAEARDGLWVVGENGFSFENSRQADYTTFAVGNTDNSVVATLFSSADWTLRNSGRPGSVRGDIWVAKNGALVIDTSDYADSSIDHTITLNGRIRTTSDASASAVTIKGCGTVVVNTTGSNSGLTEEEQNTYIASGKTLAVTNSATLQVNAGKKILGEGTISLVAGTTLALASTSSTFATPDIVPVTLPADGTATINIDGDRLRSGEHVLCTLASVPENLANHVTVTGTALGGRKYEVKAVEVTENETTITQLVLNIYPAGLMMIIR